MRRSPPRPKKRNGAGRSVGAADIEAMLEVVRHGFKATEAQLNTIVLERADGAARFEERVKEDKAERRELVEKIDGISDRMTKVEVIAEKIEPVVWKLNKAHVQKEGAQIFVGKVFTVSKAVWALIGGAVVGVGSWVLANWPWK